MPDIAMRRRFGVLWRWVGHLGNAQLLWVLGGSAVATTLSGWALTTMASMPWQVLAGLLCGIASLSLAASGLLVREAKHRWGHRWAARAAPSHAGRPTGESGRF